MARPRSSPPDVLGHSAEPEVQGSSIKPPADPFVFAKHVHEGLKRAEKQERRRVNTKAEWRDSEDVAEYKRQQRLKKRAVLLDAIVPKRICPGCQLPFLESHRWVIQRKRYACCRSCWFQGYRPAGGEKAKNPRVFSIIVNHKLYPQQFRAARLAMKISVRGMGSVLGYSKSYIQILERKSKPWWISQEKEEHIIAVLKRQGILNKV